MFRGMIFRARHVMISMGLIVTFLGNASASPNTVTVQGGRPVAKAIQELAANPVIKQIYRRYDDSTARFK